MRTRHLNTAQVKYSEFPSTDDFDEASVMPEGYVTVLDDGIPIDMFYRSKGADTTVVVFHGAVEKDIRIPWHAGTGVMKDVEANRLSISDPSLFLCEDLTIGWFAGSAAMPSLNETLRRLIAKITQLTGTEHLIFFGGSAGGFAALSLATYFPHSLALAMNPQTSIERFYPGMVKQYLDYAWPELDSMKDLPDTVPNDLVPVYSQGTSATVAFMHNSRDAFHIKNHYQPFVDSVPNEDVLWTMWGAWGSEADDGHVVPPSAIIIRVLQELAGSGGRWGEALYVAGFEQGLTEPRNA